MELLTALTAPAQSDEIPLISLPAAVRIDIFLFPTCSLQDRPAPNQDISQWSSLGRMKFLNFIIPQRWSDIDSLQVSRNAILLINDEFLK